MLEQQPKAKRGNRERSLSEATIVEAALNLIAKKGAQALTMRLLADELGVSSMAAYYHVDGKENLLRLVGDAVLSKVAVASPEAGAWDDRLRSLITRQREAWKVYPGLREALSGIDMQQRRRLEDAEFDILLEAGFTPAMAVPAFRTLLDWGLGNAYIETSLRTPGRRRPPAEWTKAQRVTFDRAVMPAMTADDYFAFGLDAVVAGLRAALDEVASRPPPHARRNRG